MVVDRPACVGTYTQSDLEYCQFLETTGSEGKVAAGISLSCIVMALDYSQQYCCNEAQPPPQQQQPEPPQLPSPPHPPSPPRPPALSCEAEGAFTYFCWGDYVSKQSECRLVADIAADASAVTDASKVVDRPACVGAYTQSDLEYCQFLDTTTTTTLAGIRVVRPVSARYAWYRPQV
jgi:hypothetical protein